MELFSFSLIVSVLLSFGLLSSIYVYLRYSIWRYRTLREMELVKLQMKQEECVSLTQAEKKLNNPDTGTYFYVGLYEDELLAEQKPKELPTPSFYHAQRASEEEARERKILERELIQRTEIMAEDRKQIEQLKKEVKEIRAYTEALKTETPNIGRVRELDYRINNMLDLATTTDVSALTHIQSVIRELREEKQRILNIHKPKITEVPLVKVFLDANGKKVSKTIIQRIEDFADSFGQAP